MPDEPNNDREEDAERIRNRKVRKSSVEVIAPPPAALSRGLVDRQGTHSYVIDVRSAIDSLEELKYYVAKELRYTRRWPKGPNVVAMNKKNQS